MPGTNYAKSLLKRHLEVSVRMSENIKRVRSAINDTVVNQYFDNLEMSVKEVPPQNIVNYDETNFTDDPGNETVIVRRGCKHPERILGTTKTSTSVMMAVTGDQKMLPPYVLYKANLYIHVESFACAACIINTKPFKQVPTRDKRPKPQEKKKINILSGERVRVEDIIG
ncbi:hypothetical protein ANN_24623 [Periplaneta americana]|uniref:Uncharacterized protein n=1 Tax=Periplaneta americana TaxID=6978 RepID=A0ABQ8S3J2_PERAM|nr:hypothetical protein ANN_24623 [Periplaneta americana]